MPDTQSVLTDELETAASFFTDLYHQMPVILTRLLMAGAAIIIGLLLLKLIRKLLNRRLFSKKSVSKRTVQQAETLRSLNVGGLYPCGEGAGYAGGILSAAVDGLKCAEALIRNTEEEA